jgi:hypothetical protein
MIARTPLLTRSKSVDLRCARKEMEFQRMLIDAGGTLPVTSARSSETRQAATPTHTVSISDITRRSMEENWLTPWPRYQHSIFKNEHGLSSRKMQLH